MSESVLGGPESLGRLIRERRRAKGYSWRAVAERSGVSEALVIAVEHGSVRVGLGEVLQILAVVGVQLCAISSMLQ